jgi:hypothetical protein
MVTANSGVFVKTNGQDSAQHATTTAGEICRLLASPEKLAALSAGAVARAWISSYRTHKALLRLRWNSPRAATRPSRDA